MHLYALHMCTSPRLQHSVECLGQVHEVVFQSRFQVIHADVTSQAQV